ncbi:hypothetical protein BDQ17DRAFT_1454716 [Cyathus striatus]|nr:hypothetical protein BDQ17DRAFT_1454716 [Cyathus striatus]
MPDPTSTTSTPYNPTSFTPPQPASIVSTTTMQFKQTALTLLHKLQQGLSSPRIELVYATHEWWPLPASSSSIRLSPESRQKLRISVFDSSFNPPTRAHLALANAPSPSLSSAASDATQENYDATLLLLSVRNVDKSLSHGDATYLQRLEMMRILSGDMKQAEGNGAIAIIDEPTFVGKQRVLKGFLENRLAGSGFHPTSA